MKTDTMKMVGFDHCRMSLFLFFLQMYQRLKCTACQVSSPLDDLCIDIWMTQMTERQGSSAMHLLWAADLLKKAGIGVKAGGVKDRGFPIVEPVSK